MSRLDRRRIALAQRSPAAARRFRQLTAERLEDRALLAALMSYEVKILPPNAPLTAAELTSVKVGESYDVAVAVKDLRPAGTGVFAGFLDILYDSGRTQVRVGEIQTIQISGGASGEFTLGFGGQTTAPIPADGSDEELAALIKAELEALSNIEAGDIRVRKTSSTNGFQVRFGGSLLDQDVPLLTGSAGIVVSTDGDLASELAFRESWRSPLSQMYPHLISVSSPISLPNLINDIGAVMDLFATPGTAQQELVRARFQAKASGETTFTPDLKDVKSPLGDTLVLTDPERALTLEEMQIGAAKTLTITPASFGVGANDAATLFEDALATPIDVLANDTTFPATGQTKEVIGVTQPANGTVTFTANSVTYSPAANFAGTDVFTYTAKNSTSDPLGAIPFTATVTVTVDAVNDAPTLDAIAEPPAILEDAGQQTIELTGISAGGGESQGLTITAASSDPDLIAPTVAYIPGTTGFVSYKPAANRSGTAVITVKVKDDGGTENSGADKTTKTFTVTVTPVNDAPGFAAGDNLVVTDESGPNSVDGWASAMVPGPQDEASQTMTFITTTSHEDLFAAIPAIDGAGRLTFTPAPNSNGTATVTVALKDSGGTENSGIDTSPPQTFTIEIENPRPLQNSEKRQDVDGNDEISPLDALLIINYLNGDNPTKITAAASSVNYYDVSGDNEIAPLDALLIINFLNAQANGEGEDAADSGDRSESLTDLIAALADDAAGQSARRRRLP